MKLTTLVIMSLWCQLASSASNTLLTNTTEFRVELLYNQSNTLENPFFWTIKAKCRIESEVVENHLRVTLLNGKATVDNEVMDTGATSIRILHRDHIIDIAAKPGSKVQLTNQNPTKETIIAYCAS